MNTLRWNRLRYTLYTPVYDLIARYFAPYRKTAVAKLGLRPGQRVLLVGAGTGLDLPYLPAGVEIHAIDLTPSMLKQLKQRASQLKKTVDARVMNGQQLTYADASFDAVILHLIVAVIPDPVRCLQEAERVLKPGGKAVIFDKFLPDDQQPAFWRRLLNSITNTLATNINRKLGDLLAHTQFHLLTNEAVALQGTFRICLLTKEKPEVH